MMLRMLHAEGIVRTLLRQSSQFVETDMLPTLRCVVTCWVQRCFHQIPGRPDGIVLSLPIKTQYISDAKMASYGMSTTFAKLWKKRAMPAGQDTSGCSLVFDDQKFVRGLYHLFFSREPDLAGQESHLKALRAGVPPKDIVATFLHSPEFLSRAEKAIPCESGADNVGFVEMLYKALLNRSPDPEGLDNHQKLLDRGLATRHQVVMMFVQSPEFKTRAASAVGRADEFAGYVAEDLAIFDTFTNAEARPRSGYVTDFVGSRVRLSSLWNGCEVLDNRVLGLPIPSDYHADALEWLGTLKAVAAARDHLAMMELGAGYGPWLAAAGAAARLRGIKRMALCGVEADPARYAMMEQNLLDNELMDQDVSLFQAAIGSADGIVQWPVLTDPRNHAGARPLRDGNVEDATYLKSVAQTDRFVQVKVVGLARLLKLQPVWDLVHIDVQGTEVELCQRCTQVLTERVRYMVIATHSRKLDGDLMELLIGAGWILEHEKPARLKPTPHSSSLIEMITHDGTQVWRNPVLSRVN